MDGHGVGDPFAKAMVRGTLLLSRVRELMEFAGIKGSEWQPVVGLFIRELQWVIRLASDQHDIWTHASRHLEESLEGRETVLWTELGRMLATALAALPGYTLWLIRDPETFACLFPPARTAIFLCQPLALAEIRIRTFRSRLPGPPTSAAAAAAGEGPLTFDISGAKVCWRKHERLPFYRRINGITGQPLCHHLQAMPTGSAVFVSAASTGAGEESESEGILLPRIFIAAGPCRRCLG